MSTHDLSCHHARWAAEDQVATLCWAGHRCMSRGTGLEGDAGAPSITRVRVASDGACRVTSCRSRATPCPHTAPHAPAHAFRGGDTCLRGLFPPTHTHTLTVSERRPGEPCPHGHTTLRPLQQPTPAQRDPASAMGLSPRPLSPASANTRTHLSTHQGTSGYIIDDR